MGGIKHRLYEGFVGLMQNIVIDGRLMNQLDTTTARAVQVSYPAAPGGIATFTSGAAFATFDPFDADVDTTVSFNVRPDSQTGTLLYQTNSDGHPDVLSVTLVAGFPVLQFNAGGCKNHRERE